MISNSELERQVKHLSEQLKLKDASLADSEKRLMSANARKHTVEKAISRQLTKTHQLLYSEKEKVHR